MTRVFGIEQDRDHVLVGLELAPDGYALGVNVLLYAMSH
jgi:hypothetical protein